MQFIQNQPSWFVAAAFTTVAFTGFLAFGAAKPQPASPQDGDGAVPAELPDQLHQKVSEHVMYTDHELGSHVVVTEYAIQVQITANSDSRLPIGPCFLRQQTSIWSDPVADSEPLWTSEAKIPLRYQATSLYPLTPNKLVVVGQNSRGKSIVEVLEMDSPALVYNIGTGLPEGAIPADVSDAPRAFTSSEQAHQMPTSVQPDPIDPLNRVLVQFHSSGDILSVDLTGQDQHYLVASSDAARVAMEPDTAVHVPDLSTYRFLDGGGRHVDGVDYLLVNDRKPFQSALAQHYGNAPRLPAAVHDTIQFGTVLIDGGQDGIYEASSAATRNFLGSVNWSSGSSWED